MDKQSGLLNKTLVIVVFILFIGVGVFPNISGYEKKSNIQLIKETPTYFPLDDDFINAYWKFDECSGNTVGDSSGHNYDGTRHGATWTSDGYVGCVLDFDGVDDYVNLTSHVREIAVNKTDDYIISLYFKSASNDYGIILSYTGLKNVPEFRIELQPNGSLLFKIWSVMCGLVLFSNESYNDGSWHKVDIFFNGITTDPTVDIYIDDNLDSTLTYWLCDIENIDFKAVAIGKRASDDSGFFDGIIDEFKFIKYEGGNKQVPPLLICGPTQGHPGWEYEYTFYLYDPEGDELWIKIDWGDGEETPWLGPYESGDNVTLSHIWDCEGAYCIRAKVKDFWGESHWSDCYEVKIGNQPPNPPTITGPRYGEPNEELTYYLISYDFEGQNIYYIVDWDDGTITETDYVQSNTTIEISHSWENINDYNITARAIDIKGKESDVSEPLWIRIANQPPRKPDIDGPIRGPVGEEIDLVFTTTDPEKDKVCFNIRWGDGEEIAETDWYNSGEPATISHIWEIKSLYLVEVRAKDTFGLWSEWASYKIKIPRYKASNYGLYELLFYRFPNLFPILRLIIGLY